MDQGKEPRLPTAPYIPHSKSGETAFYLALTPSSQLRISALLPSQEGPGCCKGKNHPPGSGTRLSRPLGLWSLEIRSQGKYWIHHA